MKLPVIGSVKLARELPEGVISHEVSIVKSLGRWYASVLYWKPPITPPCRETQAVGGVDVGVNPLAAVSSGGPESEGIQVPNLKAYYGAERNLRRWYRALERRINGLRSTAHHQLSIRLVKQFHTIGIESLNVKGMIAAALQAKSLSDASRSGLQSKIKYTGEWYGTRIVQGAQNFPSSKLCFDCEEINHSLGREKTWECPSCDRNLNAARNLWKLALLAVCEDVTLPDGHALVRANYGSDETCPVEGRTEDRGQRHLRVAPVPSL